MNNNSKRKIAGLLALLMLVQLSACGSSDNSKYTQTETTTSTDTTTAETLPEYIYPNVKYTGTKFTVLNQNECDWANPLFAPEEVDGELINDAMYNRNKRIEERFEIEIVEVKAAKGDIPTQIQKDVSAQDGVYDAAFFPIDQASGFIAENYLADLSGISTLNLNEKWWDQSLRESLEINGHSFLATSDITFHPFEATWSIVFDEEKYANFSNTDPYQLVRDGKWTLDKLTEVCKAAANLNGAENFTFDVNGKPDYGIGSISQFVQALIISMGGDLVVAEGDSFKFIGDTERQFDIYSKISALVTSEGAFVNGPLSVEFKHGHMLATAVCVGHLNNLRSYDRDFDILPLPKFDEKQESYGSMVATWGTLMTVIPVSCKDYDKSGVILDALAYDSHMNLMEPYYDTYLTQKGARNEDSAEMLGIIHDTRELAIDKVFGWTNALASLENQIIEGSDSIASLIAASKSEINSLIEKTLNTMK